MAWFVRRVRVPVIAEAELLAGGPAAVTQAGENAEIVAQGRVVATGQPIAHAVVTALSLRRAARFEPSRQQRSLLAGTAGPGPVSVDRQRRQLDSAVEVIDFRMPALIIASS